MPPHVKPLHAPEQICGRKCKAHGQHRPNDPAIHALTEDECDQQERHVHHDRKDDEEGEQVQEIESPPHSRSLYTQNNSRRQFEYAMARCAHSHHRRDGRDRVSTHRRTNRVGDGDSPDGRGHVGCTDRGQPAGLGADASGFTKRGLVSGSARRQGRYSFSRGTVFPTLAALGLMASVPRRNI